MPGARMIARHLPAEDPDYFPTPPWVTRAFVRYVLRDEKLLYGATVLEPAAGAGHMAKVLEQDCKALVSPYDIERWPHDQFTRGMKIGRRDFVNEPILGPYDYSITNPPYKLLNDFLGRMHSASKYGMAVLARIGATETRNRERLFEIIGKPTVVAFFTKRIPFAKGRIIRSGSMYFQHCWLYWDKADPRPRAPVWIPSNAQSVLERETDYDT